MNTSVWPFIANCNHACGDEVRKTTVQEEANEISRHGFFKIFTQQKSSLPPTKGSNQIMAKGEDLQ